MPKTYLNQNERQKQKIIRLLHGATKGKQKDIAEVWGVTQSAVSQRLSTGNVTLYELYLVKDLIGIDAVDVAEMIGK
jgi:predicted transcriptional regulator